MININPKEVYDKMYNAGTQWNTAKQEAEFLEENKKSFRSRLICEHLDKGVKSMAEAEARALSDPEYVEYIKTMTLARRTADDYKVKYNAAGTWFEALRTQASTLRQEMKSLPGTQ